MDFGNQRGSESFPRRGLTILRLDEGFPDASVEPFCGTGLRRNITRRRSHGGIIVGDGRGVWRRLRTPQLESASWRPDAGLARLAGLTWQSWATGRH